MSADGVDTAMGHITRYVSTFLQAILDFSSCVKCVIKFWIRQSNSVQKRNSWCVVSNKHFWNYDSMVQSSSSTFGWLTGIFIVYCSITALLLLWFGFSSSRSSRVFCWVNSAELILYAEGNASSSSSTGCGGFALGLFVILNVVYLYWIVVCRVMSMWPWDMRLSPNSTSCVEVLWIWVRWKWRESLESLVRARAVPVCIITFDIRDLLLCAADCGQVDCEMRYALGILDIWPARGSAFNKISYEMPTIKWKWDLTSCEGCNDSDNSL